jgi:hypothetical protein
MGFLFVAGFARIREIVHALGPKFGDFGYS